MAVFLAKALGLHFGQAGPPNWLGFEAGAAYSETTIWPFIFPWPMPQNLAHLNS